jgi:hypothetical protein
VRGSPQIELVTALGEHPLEHAETRVLLVDDGEHAHRRSMEPGRRSVGIW